MGQDFGNRGVRSNEALEILRLAFAGGPVEYRGAHYTIPRLRLNPSPTHPVPIWVGGESPAALRRAARLGDGWISGGAASDMAAQLPALRRELEAAGRADAPFELAASCHAPPDDAELSEWTAHGIGHLKVQPWNWWGGDTDSVGKKLATLERFAAEYIG